MVSIYEIDRPIGWIRKKMRFLMGSIHSILTEHLVNSMEKNAFYTLVCGTRVWKFWRIGYSEVDAATYFFSIPSLTYAVERLTDGPWPGTIVFPNLPDHTKNCSYLTESKMGKKKCKINITALSLCPIHRWFCRSIDCKKFRCPSGAVSPNGFWTRLLSHSLSIVEWKKEYVYTALERPTNHQVRKYRTQLRMPYNNITECTWQTAKICPHPTCLQHHFMASV